MADHSWRRPGSELEGDQRARIEPLQMLAKFVDGRVVNRRRVEAAADATLKQRADRARPVGRQRDRVEVVDRGRTRDQ